MRGNRSASRYQGGKRRSSMTHAKHAHTCRCGKVIMGNGYYSHRKACQPTYVLALLALRHDPHYQRQQSPALDEDEGSRDVLEVYMERPEG